MVGGWVGGCGRGDQGGWNELLDFHGWVGGWVGRWVDERTWAVLHGEHALAGKVPVDLGYLDLFGGGGWVGGW